MNWRLIIFASLTGALISVLTAGIIFFGFPQLSNYNVEDYIALGIFFIASGTAIFTFSRAASRKPLHALLVFFGIFLLFIVPLILLFLLIVLYCKIWSCHLFPIG